MSTSLLYYAFSIRGYEYFRTEYQGGNIVFTIEQTPKTFRCEACGSRDVRPRGRVERRFRPLPSVVGPRLSSCRSHVSPVRSVEWSAR
jgi:transposase